MKTLFNTVVLSLALAISASATLCAQDASARENPGERHPVRAHHNLPPKNPECGN